jgi:hypothetical protein
MFYFLGINFLRLLLIIQALLDVLFDANTKNGTKMPSFALQVLWLRAEIIFEKVYIIINSLEKLLCRCDYKPKVKAIEHLRQKSGNDEDTEKLYIVREQLRIMWRK